MLLSLLLALQAQPVDISSTPFPNDLTGPVGCTIFESGVILEGDEKFGGISAFRLEGDKATFLSDDAWAYTARVTRDHEGFITALTETTRRPITDINGNQLSKSEGDSESLALDGHVALVGFEGRDRIERVFRLDDRWMEGPLLYQDERELLGTNSGFEAIANLADNRLIAISEGTTELDEKAGTGGLALLLFIEATKDGWLTSENWYRPASEFSVTDASVDPQSGDLFVLERAFSRTKGPRARLVRIAAPDLFPGKIIEGHEIVRLSALNGVDNMEGLQMERRADGALVAHMISDDNYNSVQQTVLMGFRIDEQKCSATAKTRN